MSNVPFYKKIYLVNREMQLRYARAVIVIGLASTSFTAFLILYPLYVFKILVIPQFLPTPIIVAMIGAAFVNILLLGGLGILVTHRVAGPIYNIVRTLRVIGLGQWRMKMQIRSNDDLDLLVRHINELSESLVEFTEKDVSVLENGVKLISEGAAPKGIEVLETLKASLRTRIS
jgi:HAMP domain-containing protein